MSLSNMSTGAPAWGTTRLSRLAAIMCVAVAFGGAFAEIALAWVWLSPAYIKQFVAPHVGLEAASVSLIWHTQLAGFAVSMIPLGVLLFALHQAYGLFDAYRCGELFPDSAPQRLRRIGLSMLALAVLRPVTAALLSAVLTYANPPGAKMLVIGLSLDDYMIGALGGLILAIGHVMVEAKKLADDAREII